MADTIKLRGGPLDGHLVKIEAGGKDRSYQVNEFTLRGPVAAVPAIPVQPVTYRRDRRFRCPTFVHQP